MAYFPSNQRIFAVEAFIQTQSIVQTQRQFRREFDIPRHGRIPKRDTILNWVSHFRVYGNVASRFKGSTRSVRTPDNIEMVRHAVAESPTRSASRLSLALGISDRSFRRILKSDLRLHPYKMQVVQQLKEQDKIQRVQFCQQFLDMFNENANILNELIMTDEAHFHLDGYVNKQNYRYWSEENPKQLHQRPLHSSKVTVWCGVSARGIIGPYFFEVNDQAVTVNSERYVNMLQNFVAIELPRLGINNPLFQQDGATAHTARETMNVLRGMFPGRIISRFGDIHWPPRSPDLSIPDFFLWGYLKVKVYEHHPRTLQELKNAIRTEIEAIEPDLLGRVLENLVKRCQECLNHNGGHLLDVIFKK